MDNVSTTVSNVDVVIIGAGQAGVPLARALGKAGKQTVLIERSQVGGSCVNFGCTPSKGFIASARLAYQARRASEYGIRIPSVTVDFPAVMERTRKLVTESRGSLEDALANQDNPRLVRATARFQGWDTDRFRIATDSGETFLAPQVVVDTGTRETRPDIPGLDSIQPITIRNWVDLDHLPAHIVILGAGPVAIEMAQAFRRLGSEVTVVDKEPRILVNEADDVAAAMQAILSREGIIFQTGVEIARVEATHEGVRIFLSNDQTIDASHLFLALRQQANTDDLGLETIGVKPGEKGILSVNEYLQTSCPGVYAAGDIRGDGQFTNTAYDDYVTLKSQMLDTGSRTTRRALDYAIFTDPELGRVGMTEIQAREAGLEFAIGRYQMGESGRAREEGKAEGFIKVLIERDSNRFLGAACLCENGAEVVQLFTQLIAADATADTMMDALAIHPTIAEAAKNAVASVDPR